MFCLACKDWKLYATFGRHCTTYHKENDSQDVDEIEVADNAEKGPLPKQKVEPKRTSLKKSVSCWSASRARGVVGSWQPAAAQLLARAT